MAPRLNRLRRARSSFIELTTTVRRGSGCPFAPGHAGVRRQFRIDFCFHPARTRSTRARQFTITVTNSKMRPKYTSADFLRSADSLVHWRSRWRPWPWANAILEVDLVPIADEHHPGHRLTNAAQSEETTADDARAGVRKDHGPNHLPACCQRPGPFAVRARHRRQTSNVIAVI